MMSNSTDAYAGKFESLYHGKLITKQVMIQDVAVVLIGPEFEVVVVMQARVILVVA